MSMTENEAIKELETSIELAKMCTQNSERKREIEAYNMAIQALEEIQQYRAIGTIEEFKALKEKSLEKKVDEEYCCPICHTCGMDEFAERMSLEISESIIGGMLFDNRDNSSYDTADKIVDYVIDTAKKIAEHLKEGVK